MNESIKAVIFDVGGVLVRTYDHTGRQWWEKRLGLPPGGAEAVVLNSEMGHRAQRGEVSTEELWHWVGDYLNLGENLQTFRNDFWRGDAVDESLRDLLGILKNRYQMAVISNATDALLQTLDGYQLLPYFHLVVGSAFEGIMKPDPTIYKRALSRLNLAPHETVFIDDADANVLGAQKVGMNAIHFTPTMDLKAKLQNFGVTLN